MEESILGQAAASVPPLHLSYSSGCVSTCSLSLNDLLRFTCFRWQPACFFKNNPHMPQSCPSLTFPHLSSRAFLSAPPSGLQWVLWLCCCPHLSLPCASSEQGVIMGSCSGRERVCFVVTSQALLWLEQEITSVLLPTFPPALLESKGFASPASYSVVPELQQPTRRKAAKL